MSVALYSFWLSSSAYRVRIALHWKRIPFEYRAVNLGRSAHLDDDYSALNPMKEVPTLIVDGKVLTQSTAIIEYLDDVFPDRPLLPRSAFARFQVREVASVISNDMQPLGNRRVLQRVAELSGSGAAEKEAGTQAWQQRFIGGGLTGLEALLGRSAGRFCVGDEVTMADALLVPQVANARRCALDLAPFPTVARVNAALLELPEFQRAAPQAQPDAKALARPNTSN